MTNRPVEHTDCAVIGAGVIGLAVARALARDGHEVVILEAAAEFGTGISARNSEVIHAGMYYPAASRKADLCVRGNRMLRQYAARTGIAHRMTGKLIVATAADEEPALAALLDKGRDNGVEGLELIPAAQARAMEPALSCTLALWSPATGIIDGHGLMLSLLGEAEAAGAALAVRAPVRGGGPVGDGGFELMVDGAEPLLLRCRRVVLAAGLAAPALGRALGLNAVPQGFLCKGSYFALTGRMPFSRLVYPVPVEAGLGVHYTLDLAGRGRFGPDVEWVEQEAYQVDPDRSAAFSGAIRRYWPGLEDGRLEPAYAGIRPKITPPGQAGADFLIQGPEQTGAAGVAALYGIESPGLTASLAIAEQVREMLA